MLRRIARLLGSAPDYVRIAWEAFAPRAVGGAGHPQVVQAVIRKECSVLLAKRRELRGWELPGGKVEPGESDAAALAREVREEIGLEVAVERLVGVYTRSGFHAHEARVYACRVLGGALRPSREAPDVAWFETSRLPPGLFPWFRGPLDDALAEHAEPLRRAEHQGLRAIATGARIDLAARWQD